MGVTNQVGDYSFESSVFDTFSVQVLPPSRYYCSGLFFLQDSVFTPTWKSQHSNYHTYNACIQ